MAFRLLKTRVDDHNNEMDKDLKELKRRFQVMVLKTEPNIITSISEALADLNDNRIDIGYTPEYAYILLDSIGSEDCNIATKEVYKAIIDTTVGADEVDCRFIKQYQENCVIIARKTVEGVEVTEEFDFFISRDRFESIVKNSLVKVSNLLQGKKSWRIENECYETF